MLMPFPSPFLGWSAASRLLAFLVVVLLVGGGGFRWGHQVAANACRADQADAAERDLEAARHLARARSQADGVYVSKASAARGAGVTRRVALEADIARRPAPADCSLDAGSLGLFNAAIQDANSRSASPGGLHGTLPTAFDVEGREPGRPP